MKETISFTITSKRIKYLGINISKEAKDLYSENYMILFREIRDETNRWIRDTMFLDQKNQYCKNDYNTQTNLQIQCNLNQITKGIFHRIRTKNFTICLETQKTMKSQRNLEKESEAGGNSLPDLRI